MNAVQQTFETATSAHPGGLQCVVIDDSMIDRFLICHALRGVLADVEVIEFDCAADARAHLAEHGADLVLADRILPDGDGAEFATAPPAGAHVLLLSGETPPETGDGEAAEFLHKDDLTVAKLAEALSRLLTTPAEVVPLRPGTPTAEAFRGNIAEPLARGLRLLRTVRARGAHVGSDEVVELLAEIEDILVGLRTPTRH